MNSQNVYANDFGINPNAFDKENIQINQNQIRPQPMIQNNPLNPVIVIEQPKVEPPKVKKNRTLQFYKFLFYSMKIEIKVNEFVDLIRFANQSEISLWILSVVLYSNAPYNFSNAFIWIHLLHVVRGLTGFLIMLKLPRSYEIVEAMKNVPEKDLETKLFNDIARSVVKKEVVDKVQIMKCSLVFYFILTFINFIFDIIDLLYSLSHLDKPTNNNEKVILLSLFIIALLYIGKICL